MSAHTSGKGLKVLSTARWFGPGYCGICGTREEGGEFGLIARAVRYWDCDDGWRMGVLCVGCGEEATDRGPEEGDYALTIPDPFDIDTGERIDITVQLGDLDGAYSDTSQGDR